MAQIKISQLPAKAANLAATDLLEVSEVSGLTYVSKKITGAELVGNRVPYTGATSDVDLGEYELKAGQIELDQSPTGTAGVAVTRWNDSIGLTETTLKGGSVIIKNGVDLVARVVNKVSPNTTLTKAAYPVVKISGAQGQRLAVDYAQANNDNNSADTLGVVTETIATNQEGFIMTVGQLEGINTTGSLQGETWLDGDVLYLSPTVPGAVTKVKPTGATGHIVVIGYVEHAHNVNGKIYVKIMNGWELDELHNVYINQATLANNDALIYESSTQLWKNKTIATALGYTPEDVANKQSNLTASATKYPTVDAVNTGLSGKANTGAITGSGLTMATSRLLGRTTASSGAVEEITAGTGLTLSGGTLSVSGSVIQVGTSAVTSGTNGRVFFQAGGVVQQDEAFLWDTTNKRMQLLGTGVIASPAANSVLEIKAKNGLSDIAFRVRNSADTQNLMSIAGDGRFLIGQNASNTCTGGFPQYAIAIGFGAIVNGQSENYSSPIAIGYDAQSGGLSSIGIGNSVRPNTGIAIGHGVQSSAESVAIGGSTTNARGTVIGSGSSNTGYGGSAIGYNVDNTGDNSFLIGDTHTNSIASSFVWGRNGIKFWVNSNSNLVLANNKAITDANKSTYVNTSATNTITIHSGTAPTTSPADAFQQYSADITAGNAAPHFRTENGDIIKLYKNTAVTTPQGIADALTNLGVLTASTIAPSVQSVVSAATVTPVNGNDLVKITAQAAALTIANPTGTWAEGQDLMIRIKDDGLGARAITWDTNYRAIGVTLPTTTVLGKTTYVGVIYNSDDAKWDVIGVTTQA